MERRSGQNVILHDTYFNKRPSLARLFLFRLALLCAFSASAAAAVGSLYSFNENMLLICGIAAGITAVVYTLMSVFPAWAAGSALLLGGAAVCLIKKEEVAEYLGFFWDGLMLKLESRLLDTAPYLIHSREKLEAGVYDVKISAGCVLFAVIASFLFSLVVVGSCRTKLRAIPAALFIGALCAPAFAAEFAGFRFEIIPFAAIFCAICVIDTDFRLDGFLVFGKARLARESEYRSEKSYRRRTRFFVFGRKLRGDLPRYVKYNANAVTAIIITAAVAFSAAKLIPDGMGLDYRMLIDDIGRISAKLSENISDFFGVGSERINDGGYFSYSSYGEGSGGIGIGSPVSGDEPVLEVLLDSNDVPVYLRGDIGVDFTGAGWTDIKGEYGRFTDENGTRYADIFKDFYPETQYRVLRQRLSAFGYDPDSLFPLRKVSVTYLQSTRVVFVPLAPYDLNYKHNSYFDSFGDCVLRTGYGSGYLKTYESLALVPDMNSAMMQQAVTSAAYGTDYDWTLPDGLSLDEYNEKIAQYRKYVNTAYRKTNETGKRLHGVLLDEGYVWSGMDDFEIAQNTCRYFKENFAYSLDVDNGTDSEALDNFLFATKQGHCALFATAMTLAMRDMGFPARYVTGYVVSGGGEEQDNGTYLYTLREKNLHAWVEVYFDNAGWLPFDPTAGVSGFGAGEAATAPDDTSAPITNAAATTTTVTMTSPLETNAASSSEQTSITATEVSGDAPTTVPPYSDGEDAQAPQTEPKKDFAEIFAVLLPFIAAAAIIAAVITVLVMFVRSVGKAEKKAFSGFRKKAPHKAVAEMYKLTMAILARCGVTPGNEMMNDFAQRVDEELLKGSNLFMTDVMPIFIKCEFGRQEFSPVTGEERQAVFAFTSALYGLYMERINPVSRFFVKIALFL